MGFMFLWAFIDKLFGLGFATAPEKAWLNGGSPTAGFLEFAVKGPFADIYHAMAGSVIVDVLFMAGLFGIGIALLSGLVLRFASYSGVALVLLMWLAVLPPEHNPIIDEHIVYAVVLVGIALFGEESSEILGVKKYLKKGKR